MMSVNNTDPVVITSIGRTPIGDFLGGFKNVSTTFLGARVIKAVIVHSKLKTDEIDEVIMGCVLSAGVGQAPARQAALAAGLAETTPCTTINKVCGSAMKAIMLGHDEILAGSAQIIVAGGMESMTNAPYLLAKARAGYRLGHGQLLDHMMLDGLEDAYEAQTSMGVFAQMVATQYGLTRQQQDDFALQSFTRARAAIEAGDLDRELVSVTVPTKNGETVIARDEHPFSIDLDRLPSLRPVFAQNGTITAGNSSAISDGASACVLMRLSEAHRRGLQPLAKIVAHSSYSRRPSEFALAPIDAIIQVAAKIGWAIHDVDLFEINEAFAAVALISAQDLGINLDRLNVYGGAIAFGHPIGASGCRIVATLLSALVNRKLKSGIASACIGGGEATALALEILGG